MGNNIKKHERILLELKRRMDINIRFCEINNCIPTPYMDGSNKTINEMIKYIEELK